MEEVRMERVISHAFPIFGIECFGSAIINEGRFLRATGISPAPPMLEYKDGLWNTSRDWLALTRHQINIKSGAWMSSLVLNSEQQIERAVAHFNRDVAPEIVANGLCELYGVLAPAVILSPILIEVTEGRMRKIFECVGIELNEYENWMKVFAYPRRKTDAMREREDFLNLADVVKHSAMDRVTRMQVNNHVSRYGYLGMLAPAGCKLTFADVLRRVSQLHGSPRDILREETQARDRVIKRADEFMRVTGLDARERDVIKAFGDLFYWKFRQMELAAQIGVLFEDATKRLAAALKVSASLVGFMRIEEISCGLIAQFDPLIEKELLSRSQKSPVVRFAGDITEVEWV